MGKLVLENLGINLQHVTLICENWCALGGWIFIKANFKETCLLNSP